MLQGIFGYYACLGVDLGYAVSIIAYSNTPDKEHVSNIDTINPSSAFNRK